MKGKNQGVVSGNQSRTFGKPLENNLGATWQRMGSIKKRKDRVTNKRKENGEIMGQQKKFSAAGLSNRYGPKTISLANPFEILSQQLNGDPSAGIGGERQMVFTTEPNKESKVDPKMGKVITCQAKVSHGSKMDGEHMQEDTVENYKENGMVSGVITPLLYIFAHEFSILELKR